MSAIDDLVDACKAGDAGRVAALTQSDPRLLNERLANGETPLMSALYRGHGAVVEALLERGAPVDLFAAAATDRVDALQRALASGAPVDGYSYDGWTGLHLAGFFGRIAAATALLDAGAAVSPLSHNSLRNTPLHAAVAGRHGDVALLFIARGADVSAADAGTHTPLHIAAENGLTPVVKALLARGADPLAVDNEDMTPLARAAAKNHNETIDALNEYL
ncbi:MAG TPA: ankyrin repeat domain-containing protein [Vicinamibacterales bacterium]|jgi:ankyrin repeat protein